MLFDSLLKLVNQAREGETNWIPFPTRRLSKHIGIGDSTYYLIGGDPGTGKSAFTHFCFILHLYIIMKSDKYNGPKFTVTLFSLERSKEFIVAKWCAWYLLVKYSILTDVKTILGRTVNNDIIKDDDFYNKILECRAFIDELESTMLNIIDDPQNPTSIWKHMNSYAQQVGEIDKSDEENPIYVPNDKNMINVFIVDHIGKVRSEGMDDRKTLAKLSEYCGLLRDRYSFSPVLVSQFNRSLSDSTRRTRLTLAPEKSDFKGASNMYEDADIVLGMFNPHEYHMSEELGYNIRGFINSEGYNRYRSIHVLKNHFGADNLSAGMGFIGETGHFRELPMPHNMTTQDYQRFANPKATIRK